MGLNDFFDLIFGDLVNWSPIGALIIISFIMTLIVTLIYKYATDQELMKSSKKEIKEIQKKVREFKHDPQKAMAHNKELMQKQLEMFKQSFKPMLITMLPVLLLFTWLRSTYGTMGDIFIGFGWLGNYIIFSIVFSLILRKLLRVH